MQDNGSRVLIIDDEPQIQRLLKVSLKAYGYQVISAANGHEGLLLAASTNPDVIIVDLGLPDMDGKEVVRQIREWSVKPIVILSARENEKEKVAALDFGADDYVTKPFGVEELMARLRVCIRHSVAPEKMPVCVCGDLEINFVERRVTLKNQEIKLTPTEYLIIRMMAQYPGRVLTHTQLLKEVWGKDYVDEVQYLRVYVGQLRRKIEEDPAQPRYIITESGVGYRLMCGELPGN